MCLSRSLISHATDSALMRSQCRVRIPVGLIAGSVDFVCHFTDSSLSVDFVCHFTAVDLFVTPRVQSPWTLFVTSRSRGLKTAMCSPLSGNSRLPCVTGRTC